MNQGSWATSRSWKIQANSPLEPPERSTALPTPGFWSNEISFWTSDLQNWKIIKLCHSKLLYIVICYSRNRNLIHLQYVVCKRLCVCVCLHKWILVASFLYHASHYLGCSLSDNFNNCIIDMVYKRAIDWDKLFYPQEEAWSFPQAVSGRGAEVGFVNVTSSRAESGAFLHL